MTLQKFQLKSGINLDDTPLSSEGGWTAGDKVRFVRGQPQTIGGWDLLTAFTFEGIARGAHAWGDIVGHRFLAWGTAAKLFVYLGGVIKDITPKEFVGVLQNPFFTTSGSATVTVLHTGHGLDTDQLVTFSNQSAAVGGLTLNGVYPATVTDDNHYTIMAASNASSTVAGGGGYVDVSYAIVAGRVDGVGTPGGYGSGGYSEGGYGGTVTSAATQPMTWSLDNFGSNLLAVPRGGALYEYQPVIGSLSEMVTGGDFAVPTGWTTGTGWSIGAGVATAVAGSASDLSTNVAFEEGAVYQVTFTVTRTAGTLTFKTNGAALTGYGASSPISVSGTYTRLFRATVGSTQAAFSKDSAFAGTIDNVSIKLAGTAYRVVEAPGRNEGMFVDPRGIVVLTGTTPYLDVFNPMAVRWSDIQDVTAWTPAQDNLASDVILSTGARIMAGRVLRAQNLIWTDVGLYTMTFTGDANDPFSFSLTGTGCGLIGPLAKAEHNGVAYWVSKDNFFVFQGVAPQPIPSTVKRDFFEHIAGAQQEKILAGVNAGFSEIWFFYPDSRDGKENSRYVSYQFEENVWACGTFNRTSWVGAGVFEQPIAMGADSKIYVHERGQTAVGGPLASYIEASYFDLEDGENLIYLRRFVPDFEGQVGPIAVDLSYKRFPNATEVAFPQKIADLNTEKLDFRLTARQIKFRLSGNASPSFYRLGAIRADVVPTSSTR